MYKGGGARLEVRGSNPMLSPAVFEGVGRAEVRGKQSVVIAFWGAARVTVGGKAITLSTVVSQGAARVESRGNDNYVAHVEWGETAILLVLK